MTILGEGNPSFFSFHRVKLAERHPAPWWRSPSRSISCGGWIQSFCPSQRRCLSHNGICPNFHWTSTSTLRLEFETMRKAYPGSHSDCLADPPIWRVNLSLWNNVGWREGRKGAKRRKKKEEEEEEEGEEDEKDGGLRKRRRKASQFKLLGPQPLFSGKLSQSYMSSHA